MAHGSAGVRWPGAPPFMGPKCTRRGDRSSGRRCGMLKPGARYWNAVSSRDREPKPGGLAFNDRPDLDERAGYGRARRLDSRPSCRSTPALRARGSHRDFG